jgi:hypothetical protein
VALYIYTKKGDEKMATKYYHEAENLFSSLKLDHLIMNMDHTKTLLFKEMSSKNEPN